MAKAWKAWAVFSTIYDTIVYCKDISNGLQSPLAIFDTKTEAERFRNKAIAWKVISVNITPVKGGK